MGKVSYTLETLPPVSRNALDQAAAMADEDIDYSDIPNLAGAALRSRPVADNNIYKPVKVAVTCKLDADIVEWLKQGGKGYQTRLNSILRQVMTRAR